MSGTTHVYVVEVPLETYVFLELGYLEGSTDGTEDGNFDGLLDQCMYLSSEQMKVLN